MIARCDSSAIFVALKDYTVVLNKSVLPKIASDKEKAWCLAVQFSKNWKQTSIA